MKTLPKLLAVGIACAAFGLPRVCQAGPPTLADFGCRRMATNNEVGSTRPMLVILANFPAPSAPFTHGTNIAYYSNLVFEVSSNKSTVNGYFKEVSNDRFRWTPTRVLRVDLPEAHRFEHMVDDSHFASNIIYWAVLTNNFDWEPYNTSTANTNVTDRELAVSIFSNDTMLSARYVSRVKPPGVSRPYEGLVYIGTCWDGFATTCHEIAHILGTTDFYGIWGTGECLASHLSLMSCTGDEKYHLDAWHKMQFGWSEPRIYSLNSSGSVSLPAAQRGIPSAPIILYDTNRGVDDFFLLEYRTQNVTGSGGGYDVNVAGNGLVIWHVAHKPDKWPPLIAELAWPDAERGWRECIKCRSLLLGTSPTGQCAAGGTHTPFVDDHGLVKNDPSEPGQPGWKRCTKCHSLYYGPNQAASNCPGGGTHSAASGDYTLTTDSPVLAHHYWRRCTKCETLFLAWLYPQGVLTTNGVCAVGGTHNGDPNVEYTLPCFWGLLALQPEAHPDLRRGASDVWPSGSITPSLRWFDGTLSGTRIVVQPFTQNADQITIEIVTNYDAWVDFPYGGSEDGSFAQPFNTFAEGTDAVYPGGVLHIKAGTSSETRHVTKPMKIESYGGPATVGRQ